MEQNFWATGLGKEGKESGGFFQYEIRLVEDVRYSQASGITAEALRLGSRGEWKGQIEKVCEMPLQQPHSPYKITGPFRLFDRLQVER